MVFLNLRASLLLRSSLVLWFLAGKEGLEPPLHRFGDRPISRYLTFLSKQLEPGVRLELTKNDFADRRLDRFDIPGMW